ncbi:hypothetical protein M409DRAFT_18087 [Zasmidium cellare ATCC 36951]|uniref:mRNA-capping enzyme subunit alpha n=1 Tax=Zasmidium cellare ATCC 36951 TaxID=1080233 RepID=A0A6A6CXH1_ZASCE|nr:uncharacterized protein M409DRAFT_18087 [Zasmidium cellare ATCC 36951]KAF2171854.1 hypothetical protein M409DRAFT_18087 [Zasmidium cellare ATCC 36951]
MGSSVTLDAVAKKIPRDVARFHQDTVADLLKRPHIGFPGAQPVSFARKHLLELEGADYFVAEKTDGIRCLLYLTTILDGTGKEIEAQFLIDRKNDYYYVEPGYLHIPPVNMKPAAGEKPYMLYNWHIGTILDGELVRDRYPNGKEELTFLVFDMLALDNECITHRTFDTRVGKIGVVLDPLKAFMRDYPADANEMRFQLRRKDPQLGYAAEMMFKDVIPKLTHGNDGLIYTCRSTPYVAGTDPHILKWKPPHENTIDFRLQLGSFPLEEDDEGTYEDFDQKPEIELLVYHGDRDYYKKFADLYLADEEWEAMKSMNEAFDWRIIECWREADTGRWRPKLDDGRPRFRDDKEHANHISTVDSVLESIEDAVSEQDLIDSAGRIKAAWKERAAVQTARKEHEQKKRQEALKAQQAQEAAQRASATKIGNEAKAEEDDDQPRYED